MIAAKILIGNDDKFKMQRLVPELNSTDNLMAVIVEPNVFIIAASSASDYVYAKDAMNEAFDEYSTETIKY